MPSLFPVVSPASDVTASMLAGLVSRAHFCTASEALLQEGLSSVFAKAGLRVEREVVLAKTDRVDFLVDGIALEVKVDGSLSAVTRQLHRYAQHDRIRELVLVTTLMRHRVVPTGFNGKPITVVHLIGSVF